LRKILIQDDSLTFRQYCTTTKKSSCLGEFTNIIFKSRTTDLNKNRSCNRTAQDLPNQAKDNYKNTILNKNKQPNITYGVRQTDTKHDG